MNNVLGYDIIKWYRENGTLKDMDCMLKQEDKLDYIRKIKAHGNEKGVSVYVGENETVCRQQSCHGECCGTHLLRNHNVMANAHTDACRLPNRSHALDDCKVGMRSTRFKGKTIREIITLKSLH